MKFIDVNKRIAEIKGDSGNGNSLTIIGQLAPTQWTEDKICDGFFKKINESFKRKKTRRRTRLTKLLTIALIR